MLDFAELQPRKRPNWYLVAPPGLCRHATPHRAAPVFPFDRASLITRVHTLLSREPQIAVLESSADGGRMRLVQRTPIMRWPDYVDIAVLDAEGGSTLAIYSRSKFGYRDFGANRKRVEGWLAEREGRG
jgi:uncharacterized protein (DUF1499 family)